MNKKSLWCWMIYALPPLALVLWAETGHLDHVSARMMLWLYGFPSTALVLPVVSLFRIYDGLADLLLVSFVTVLINGAVLALVVHLVREAMKPEPAVEEAATETKSDPHLIHEARVAK